MFANVFGDAGAVIFDAYQDGEWEALKATNLHDDLHDIVTQHWQAAVRESSVQNVIEPTYARNLGANYAKSQEVKAWLQTQPQKSLILAYLADTKLGAGRLIV
jgi:hypothetical protein